MEKKIRQPFCWNNLVFKDSSKEHSCWNTPINHCYWMKLLLNQNLTMTINDKLPPLEYPESDVSKGDESWHLGICLQYSIIRNIIQCIYG